MTPRNMIESWRARLCVGILALMLLAPGAPVQAVEFGTVQDLQGGIGFATVLTLGPEDPDPASNADGCIYAVSGNSGIVHRVCFDSTKSVISNTQVIDLNDAGGTNNTLGITIDPASDPDGEIHLYLGYADNNGAPMNGKIARAVSVDGGVSYVVDEDFITGLGRSSFDHQTNGLDFGNDGCLYVSQGNNSNAGYDSAFAESRLSSAILRACFKDGSGGVDAAFDRNCGDGNVQEACDVEVYASGLRNPYDIVWHSNGLLYNSDNDANPGFRDSCPNVANTFGCVCQEPVVGPVGDEINLIEQGAYYGSPNPYRANPFGLQCQGGTSGGDACTVDGDCGGGGTCADLSAICTDSVCGDVSQCFYFGYGEPPLAGEDPNNLYREPLLQTGGLFDGLTEFASRFDGRFPGSFCSDWNGDLLVTGGPGALRRVDLAPDGLTAAMAGTVAGGDILDVVVGPDGTIYMALLSGNKVSYLVPLTQADPTQSDFFLFCDVAVEFGQWDLPSAPASLPTGRSDLAAATLEIGGGDYLFVFGQQGTNSVLRYDVAADVWASTGDAGTPGAPPNPPFALNGPPTSNHKAAVTLDNFIYTIGGLNPFDHDTWGYDGIGDPVGNHFSHIGCNGATQNCTGGDHVGTVTDNGLNVGSVSEAVIDGQIYIAGGLCNTTGAGAANCTCGGVVGGNTGNCSGNTATGSANTDRAFRYVPSSDDWYEVASMPVAVDHGAGATWGGRFYVFGGRQCGQNVACEGRDEVQIYAPQTDSWSFGTPMPEGCSGMGNAVVLNNRIYVIGGEGSPCSGTKVQEYNPAADSWRLVTDLPDTHHGIWPVVIGNPSDGVPNRVHLAGGSPASTHHHAFEFSCEECSGSSAAPPAPPTSDQDGDGVDDFDDNCPQTANADQADDDSDMLGDVCDPCPGNQRNIGLVEGGNCGATGPALFRINSGGASLVDSLGLNWSADSGFTGGSTFATADPISGIPGAADAPIYQSERYGDPFSYSLNGGADGDYLINLHFAEIFLNSNGLRAFDVFLPETNQQVIDNLDIHALVGHDAALVKSFVSHSHNGIIDILLNLGPDGIDNAKISGIEVFPLVEACLVDGDCPPAHVCVDNVCAEACTLDTDCDDQNPCTDDFCNASVCENTPEPATTPCDNDADLCTVDECDGAGVCGNVDIVTCNPGDTCNPGTGVCESAPADPDNDGLFDSDDPCPDDPRNLCFGPVAVDGTTGNEIRLNANVSAAECSGTKIDCNGDTWLADFGYNQAGSAATCDLGGGAEGCVIAGIVELFGCEDESTEDIFQCEHWDPTAAPELIYDFDLADGNYVVNLLFANSFTGTSTAGTRLFDIFVNGVLEYDEFDQVVAAGADGTAVVRAVAVTVSDGNGLQIELGHSLENTTVKGIEILAEGIVGCVIDGDCDDLNGCTLDTCDPGTGSCANTPVSDGTGCDDGVFCTFGDSCSGGQCEAGAPDDQTCDDQNLCTIDICDIVLGCVSVPATDGTVCDDELLCTDPDECNGGVCGGADICPGQSCDPVSGLCGAVDAAAFVSITPTGLIDATTFSGDAFQITNDSLAGGPTIVSVTWDLSTAMFPDIVFDPADGTPAGDSGSSCITPSTGAAATGYLVPADACVDPYSDPNELGYYKATVTFNDFDPGEFFAFNADVDPTSIQGGATTGAAGAVSGLEATGTTVTVEFSDGTILTAQTFQVPPASEGGSQATMAAGAPAPPSVAILGVPVTPTNVNNPNQTLLVGGNPGDVVRVLIVEGGLELFQAPGFDLQPFEANEALVVQEYTAVVGPTGLVEIPVVLTLSTVGPDFADVGLNHIVVVIENPTTGQTSSIVGVDILRLVAGEVCLVDGDCDDANPCTNDSCGTEGLCENTPDIGASCDDGDACTTADECDGAGSCVGIAQPDGTVCDDLQACTANDECNAGVCAGTFTDSDNDGLGEVGAPIPLGCDPCPGQPLNECFGTVAVDLASGNDIRINTGPACTTSVTDCRGETWNLEFGAVANQSSSVCNLPNGCPVDSTSVFGCTDVATEDLAKCEHYDPPALPELQYSFDIPDGLYLVNLVFMNAYGGTATPGTRIFDVSVESVIPPHLAGFDQVVAAGGPCDPAIAPCVPVNRATVVQVVDGNGLQIDFVHGIENPAIKGIEVLQGSIDDDGDGFGVFEGDCDDNDASSFPGAAEVCDGNDNDCDGTIPADELDADLDGHVVCGPWVDTQGDDPSIVGGDDCDDEDDSSFPGAVEVCDGNDNDCDGTIPLDETDADSDGYAVCTPWDDTQFDNPSILGGGDCDDTEASSFPGNPEICDGVDNDCDLETDEEPEASASCAVGDICIASSCQPETQATIILPTGLEVPVGGDIVVPIIVDPADGAIAFDLRFTYDPAVVQPVGVFTTPFASEFFLTTNLGLPGEVLISLFDDVALVGTGEVAWVVFHAVGPAGSGSDLTWVTSVINEGGIVSTDQDGRVDIVQADSTLSLPDCASAPQGGMTWVPVTATPADDFFGVDLEVQYDSTILEALDVRVASPLDVDFGCSVISNLASPGVVGISFFCTSPLVGDVSIVEIKFMANGATGVQTPLDLSQADVNEGAISSTLDDGFFLISPDNDGDGFTAACGDCDDTRADVYPGAPELCDGLDNDCDAETPDGSDETTLGNDCDGDDSDLCDEGLVECSGGALSCTDGTDDNVELCDGLDNDCNPATGDGADESTLGEACDGDDTDLCTDDLIECTGGSLVCSAGDDNVELCDGLDNDCDTETDEDFGLGLACGDGVCAGGLTECTTDGLGTQCSTGPGGSDDQSGLELCDGQDNDCNGLADFPGETTDADQDGSLTCEDCNDADPENFPGNAELCDGQDNDCDGVSDNGFGDLDGDGFGDACDCDPNDPLNLPPTEVGDSVRVDKSGTDALIEWDDEGLTEPFRVYRGIRTPGTAFVYNHTCMTPPLATPAATDPIVPLSDRVFYYLVSRDECGESGLGTDSAGTPRPNDTPCGVMGSDADGDGVDDSQDNCPGAANPLQEDADSDTHGDVCDNCPADPNPLQENLDGDPSGDACDPDIDGDGFLNGADNCPAAANDQSDADIDGVGDACDNCPDDFNPGQEDTDVDSIGDACDLDPDNDGVLDPEDNCPMAPNPGQENFDGDALGDACDLCIADPDNDLDSDGVCGDVDNCPSDANAAQDDSDLDDLGDVCDPCPSNPSLACVACPSGTDPDGDGVCSTQTVLIEEGTAIGYLANTTDPGVGMGWVAPGFPVGGWSTGTYGVGYEAGTGAENLISTPVSVGSASVYTRVVLGLGDPSGFNRLDLGADHDDGYAVWINGFEVYRSPQMPLGPLDWDSLPSGHESSNGTDPDYGAPLDLSAVGLGLLAPGPNVVAIGVWNNSPASTDLVLVPRLSVSEGDNCPTDSNPDQTDGDSDGFGDLCDATP